MVHSAQLPCKNARTSSSSIFSITTASSGTVLSALSKLNSSSLSCAVSAEPAPFPFYSDAGPPCSVAATSKGANAVATAVVVQRDNGGCGLCCARTRDGNGFVSTRAPHPTASSQSAQQQETSRLCWCNSTKAMLMSRPRTYIRCRQTYKHMGGRSPQRRPHAFGKCSQFRRAAQPIEAPQMAEGPAMDVSPTLSYGRQEELFNRPIIQSLDL